MPIKKKKKKKGARFFKAVADKKRDFSYPKKKKKKKKEINGISAGDMLPKKNRLSRRVIREVIKKGKTVRSGNISLKYLIFSPQKPLFSFVVSLKTVKNAASRNKLKRRGRAVVFGLLPSIKEGYRAVIFFGKESEKLRFPALKEEITKLFRKAGIL